MSATTATMGAEIAAAADAGRPLLLRGGTVITMDDAAGTFEESDVLIVGERIAAVGARVDAPADALVVDASGRIVMPGLIDAHRHTWEAVVRGLGADWSLFDYFQTMPGEIGPLFEPDDVYAANLLAATECVNDGVTSLGDWSDNAGRSAAYADAAIRGLADGGVRGRFHYANLFAPAQEWGASDEVERLWSRYGSPEGQVSMQMGIDSTRDPAFPEGVALRFAKERGIPVATHAAAFGWDHEAWIGRLHEHDLLGVDFTYLHVVAAPDAFVQMIADTGGAVTMASCSNCHYGQGFPNTRLIRGRGIPVGLGSDNEMRSRMSMHDVMHGTLVADHLSQHLEAHAHGHVAPILELRTDGVMAMATRGGARSLGLQKVTGSLTPGLQADVVVMTPNPVAMPHRWDAAAHVVFQTGPGDVEAVLVAGRVRKWAGALVGLDLRAAQDRANRSRGRLIERIGEGRARALMTGPASDPSAPAPETL